MLVLPECTLGWPPSQVASHQDCRFFWLGDPYQLRHIYSPSPRKTKMTMENPLCMKMYFLLKIVIFQSVMLVFIGVTDIPQIHDLVVLHHDFTHSPWFIHDLLWSDHPPPPEKHISTANQPPLFNSSLPLPPFFRGASKVAKVETSMEGWTVCGVHWSQQKS